MSMHFVTSWDDGDKRDMRIADLLKERGFDGVFFISNKTNELTENQIKHLHNIGFQIGGHTVSHTSDLKDLSHDKIKWEVQKNKDWLEAIIGNDIKSFCYPEGTYDKRLINIVRECGFTGARTTDVLQTDSIRPSNRFEIGTTIHAYPNRSEYDGRNWLDIAKEKFDEAQKKDGYYHLWGRSWQVEKFDCWQQLKELLNYIYERR